MNGTDTRLQRDSLKDRIERQGLKNIYRKTKRKPLE